MKFKSFKLWGMKSKELCFYDDCTILTNGKNPNQFLGTNFEDTQNMYQKSQEHAKFDLHTNGIYMALHITSGLGVLYGLSLAPADYLVTEAILKGVLAINITGTAIVATQIIQNIKEYRFSSRILRALPGLPANKNYHPSAELTVTTKIA